MMGLVCTLCGKFAKYKTSTDFGENGRFVHNVYYCDEHKPVLIKAGELDKTQNANSIKIYLKTPKNKGDDE